MLRQVDECFSSTKELEMCLKVDPISPVVVEQCVFENSLSQILHQCDISMPLTYSSADDSSADVRPLRKAAKLIAVVGSRFCRAT